MQSDLPTPVETETPEPVPSAPLASVPVGAILEGRLHPLTLVLGLISSLRKLIIPAIPILLLGDKLRWGGIGLFGLLIAGAMVSILIRYFSFSYRVEETELITREGVIERQERHIPLDQVQEIRIEQSLLQRAFDVVEAVVETAGAEGAEATLSVLSRDEAERLRAAVRLRSAKRRASDAVPEQPTREVIRKLSIGDLIWHGLTSNHLLSAMAIVGAIWAFADDVLPQKIYEQLGGALKIGIGQLYQQGLRAALLIALLGLAVVIIVGMMVSTVGSIVLFFNFTLSRQGDDLLRRYGLITRRSSSLPRQRIQVLKIEEGMVRRWFGLATLRADISGSKKEGEDDNSGRDVLMPVVKRREIDRLLAIFFPSFSAAPSEWKKVSPLAIRRGTVVGTLILFVIAAVVSANLHSFAGFWLLLLTPLLYWINTKSYRNFGYVLGEHFFCTRSGWLGRETHIVPIEKSQVIVVRQSFFDRRLKLASLSIDTAGQAYTGGSPSISNLPIEEALSVARTLARKASQAGARF